MTLSEKLDSISDHRSSHNIIAENAPELLEEMQLAIGKMLVEVTCAPIESFTHSALICLLYTSPSPRDLSTSRMPSSA